jgi:ubiquinone/menaquinone biosynthesis C-methylase UbiE
VLPSGLDSRGQQIVARYINDCGRVVREIHRVLRRGGQATFVVADATVRGGPILVSDIVDELATVHRMRCVERLERSIPSASRYLPPPTDGSNTLDKRMRVEHCLTYKRN